MNINTINHLLAIKIMNYKYMFHEQLGLYGYKTSDGFRSSFRPAIELTDAYEVIKEIQKDYAWKMEMYNEALEVEVQIGKGYYSDKSIPLAISIATLKNYGIDYEDD